MAYINLSSRLPGIVGLLETFSDTAKPLSELAQVLLRGDSTLSPGERELIAAYVSSRNDCTFCQHSHGAAARYLLEVNPEFIELVKKDAESAEISSKLKALLVIAGQVQQGGLKVSEESISEARSEGATDREIHDTVLISAAFCMYNRYVDGLGTWAPETAAEYEEQGLRLAEEGYTA